MGNTRRKLLLNSIKIFDSAMMILAVVAAELVMVHQSRNVTIAEFLSMRVKVQNFAILGLFILAWHLIFGLSGLYNSRRLSGRRDEITDVIRATVLGTFVLWIGAMLFHIGIAAPLFLIIFWSTSTCTIGCSRLMLRAFLAFVRKQGRNLRDVVIVGTNARALEFARKLISHPELGYRITGFVDQSWSGLEAFRNSGYALASDFSSFPQFLRSSVVDEVVMALPFRSMHDQGSQIAALCEEQGIRLRVLTNIYDLKKARSSAEELEGEGDTLITHSTGSLEGWPIFVKRILDFTISSIVLALLSPVLVVVAIVIKFTAPGPILFVQPRLGLNKRRFNVYKFRTMVLDAESRMCEVQHLNEVRGPVFKIKNDPRITATGRFLRKTSLDELPQLFNVLRGDMSLVGPRPLPVRDYEGFNEDWQRRRFSVKPGITCLWQIQGRSSIPFEKWMELDLQYIDRWSLRLDFQILLRTIPAVLKGSGAV